MNARIRKFLQEEDGITALEYGVLAAIVAAVLVAVFKTGLSDVFNQIMLALKQAITDATT